MTVLRICAGEAMGCVAELTGAKRSRPLICFLKKRMKGLCNTRVRYDQRRVKQILRQDGRAVNTTTV